MMKYSNTVARVLTVGAVMCALTLSWSAAAVAQGSAPTLAEPITHSFEPDALVGAFISPGDEAIVGRAVVKTKSLIKVRTNFIPELMMSVADVGP